MAVVDVDTAAHIELDIEFDIGFHGIVVVAAVAVDNSHCSAKYNSVMVRSGNMLGFEEFEVAVVECIEHEDDDCKFHIAC